MLLLCIYNHTIYNFTFFSPHHSIHIVYRTKTIIQFYTFSTHHSKIWLYLICWINCVRCIILLSHFKMCTFKPNCNYNFSKPKLLRFFKQNKTTIEFVIKTIKGASAISNKKKTLLFKLKIGIEGLFICQFKWNSLRRFYFFL